MSQNKKYKLLADFLTISHFVWGGLLLGGLVFSIFHNWYIKYHLIIISGTLLSNLPFQRRCPLTVWEERARQKIYPAYTNNGSFMATYVTKVFHKKMSRQTADRILRGVKIASYAISVSVLVF